MQKRWMDEALYATIFAILIIVLTGKQNLLLGAVIYMLIRFYMLAHTMLETKSTHAAGLTLKYARQTPDGDTVLGYLLYNRSEMDMLIENIDSIGAPNWAASITFRQRVSGLLDYMPDRNIEKIMWLNGTRQGDGSEIISIAPSEHIGIEYITKTATIKNGAWRAWVKFSLPPHKTSTRTELYTSTN